VWIQDSYFNANTSGARSRDVNVTNGGTLDPVFSTYRVVPIGPARDAVVPVYEIPVRNGEYDLRLYFAEIFFDNCTVGTRVFDVIVEGRVVLPAYDICARAGASFYVVIEDMPVLVIDRSLSIAFRAQGAEYPQINALALYTVPVALTPLLRIDSGSTVPFTHPSTGARWQPDAYFLPDTVPRYPPGINVTTAAGSLSALSPVLQSYRLAFRLDALVPMYELPVPASGLYVLRLYFAEIYYANCVLGARVFNVFVEGSLALPQYDICATALNSRVAVSEDVWTVVQDGSLSLAMRALSGNFPQVNAVEVLAVQRAVLPLLPMTSSPTAEPTETPTENPTEEPSAAPSFAPTHSPSARPTHSPSAKPTAEPSMEPTDAPSLVPTRRPHTHGPTKEPSDMPSNQPTDSPSEEPTALPSAEPTALPSEEPTAPPSEEPTVVPSEEPSALPSLQPTAPPSEEPPAP